MSQSEMSHAWGWLKPEERDFDAVLQRLLKEASEVLPGLSPDPRVADPVVVMLLRSFAREYVELYQVLDDSVGMAYRTLVSRLLAFPHAPEPATTVLALKAKDAGTKIPTDFQAVAAQPIVVNRRSVQAHFSPVKEGAISSFEVAALVVVAPNGQARRLPDPPLAGQPETWAAESRRAPTLYIALDSPAPDAADPFEVFLYGPEEAVRRTLWSAWDVPAPAGGAGCALHGAGPEPPYVPAEVFYRATPFDPPIFTFRSDMNRIQSTYSVQFVTTGCEALRARACDVPKELGTPGPALPPRHGKRHWVRVTLAEGSTLEELMGLQARTNAVLAANREVRTSGAVGVDDTPSHSWNLTDDVTFENLLAVERVLDLKSGHLYAMADTRAGSQALRSYRVSEWLDGARHRVRVEMMNRDPERRRTELEILFSLTLGPDANGLATGTISQVYTPAQVFPGLLTVSNLVPTVGGRPVRSATLQEDELRSALRHRGRAVVTSDYVELSLAFDPDRIRGVTLGRGVTRRERGLRSTVEIHAGVVASSFVNDLEREALRRRLEAYLQDRSAMGETVQVVFEDAAP